MKDVLTFFGVWLLFYLFIALVGTLAGGLSYTQSLQHMAVQVISCLGFLPAMYVVSPPED